MTRFKVLKNILILNWWVIFALTASFQGCSKETQAKKIKNALGQQGNTNQNNPNPSVTEEESVGGSTLTEETESETDTDTTTSPSVSLAGDEIYNQKCSGCHGNLASSSKRGRSADQISSSSGIPAHQGIAWPSKEEIEAIAIALSQ